jgi:hypothetical protein
LRSKIRVRGRRATCAEALIATDCPSREKSLRDF